MSEGKIVLTETYDMCRINNLLYSDTLLNIYKNDDKKYYYRTKKQLEYIHDNNGKIVVKYSPSMKDIKGTGRLYADNGLQMVNNEIRKYLQEGMGLIDIDIKNSICSVMLELCKQYKIK